MEDGVDWRALNWANWDDRVPVHLASSFYDLPGLRAGASTLRPWIVTSLVQAGLRIEFLHEHDFEAFGRFESLQRREDGTYRFPPGQPRVPMMYSLRASAPGVA